MQIPTHFNEKYVQPEHLVAHALPYYKPNGVQPTCSHSLLLRSGHLDLYVIIHLLGGEAAKDILRSRTG